MSAERFTFTVMVRRSGGRGPWGDAQSPSTHEVAGCVKWPRVTNEAASSVRDQSTDFSQSVATGYMLHVPAGSDLLASDEIQLPGDTSWWQVNGDPLPWGPSPFTGKLPGIIVALTRGTG